MTEIRGVLVEADSLKPLDGVEIGVHWRDHRRTVALDKHLDQTFTAADGSFLIRTPMTPAEPFRIHVEGRNTIEFITDRYASLPAQPLRIEAPAGGGWIAGRVVTAAGHPVPGGFIKYSLPAADADMALLNDAPVDTSGHFLIGPLALADYSLVHVFRDAASSHRLVESRPVRARPTKDPALLTGEVVIAAESIDVVKINVLDPAGRPLTDGWVYALANTEKGSLEFGAAINASGPDRGAACLVGTLPGRYIVRLSNHDELIGWTEFAYAKKETGVPTLAEVTLRTDRGSAGVEGRVLVDGRPSTATCLFIHSEAVGNYLKTADSLRLTCDADGRFISKPVAPGKFRLYTDSTPGLSRFEQEFDLADGEIRKFAIELQTLPSARLTGRITDRAGNPIERAWIKIIRSNSNLQTQTGPDGRYDIACPENPHANRDLSEEYRARLAPGQERVEILVNHHEFSGPARRYVVLSLNETNRADFTLHPLRRVTLECLPADGFSAADLPTSFTLPLTFPSGFYWNDLAPRVARFSSDAAGRAVVEDFPFPQDVYGRFALDEKSRFHIARTEWIRDGVLVGEDRHGIPLDDPAAYAIRLVLAPRQADPSIHLRLVDHLSGKPVEGIRIVVSDMAYDNFQSLPDGRCTRPYIPGNPLLFQDFFAVQASDGELEFRNGRWLLNFPAEFRTDSRRPVEVRGVRLIDRRMIQVQLFDSFGADITGRVIALDGDLEWKPVFWSEGHATPILALGRTAGDVHEFMFILDNGDPSPIESLNPLPPGMTIARDKTASPVLRVDFARMEESSPPLRLLLKNALFIPAIDDKK